MGKYISNFDTMAAYEAAESSLATPHVSLTKDNMQVHYIPYVETRVIATFNVTDTSSSTKIGNIVDNFSSIEIDGVEQPSVVSAYTFDTLGEHTVKYTLIDSTSIGNSAFFNCTNLTSVEIPSSVTSIDNTAFAYCINLTSCIIGSGVTSIGNSAFNQCTSLISCTIGNGVTSIGGSAFRSCTSLTSIEIPNSVTSIGYEAFYGCTNLTSIDILDSATSIGESAFEDCTSLTSCTLGSGVTSIGGSAFRSCTSLTSIEIPDSVTSIGSTAFRSCTSLTSIVSNATTAPTIQSTTFRDVKTGGTLTVPIGSSGYDVWMGTGNYYLGKYNWTKVEQ
jgi:hypothetical protein